MSPAPPLKIKRPVPSGTPPQPSVSRGARGAAVAITMLISAACLFKLLVPFFGSLYDRDLDVLVTVGVAAALLAPAAMTFLTAPPQQLLDTKQRPALARKAASLVGLLFVGFAAALVVLSFAITILDIFTGG